MSNFTCESIVTKGYDCANKEQRGWFGHNFLYAVFAMAGILRIGKVAEAKEIAASYWDDVRANRSPDTYLDWADKIAGRELTIVWIPYLMQIIGSLGDEFDSFLEASGETAKMALELYVCENLDQKSKPEKEKFNTLLRHISIDMMLYGAAPDEIFKMYV